MTVAQITRIFNNTGWTGKDLGMLELTNACILHQQTKEGKPPAPLIEHAQLLKLIDSINNVDDFREYRQYIEVHSWLNLHHNIAQANFQQAQARIVELSHYLELAACSEKVLSFAARFPVIMTEKQYKEITSGKTPELDRRAAVNGVAVLQPGEFSPTGGLVDRTDEQGHYIEPSVNFALPSFSLEDLFPEAGTRQRFSQILELDRKFLNESYYHIKGYNLSLELMAKQYKIPELEYCKLNLEPIDTKKRIFNSNVEILSEGISRFQYLDENQRPLKIQALKEYFYPVDFDALTVPPKSVTKAKELLKDFKAFLSENVEYFRDLLCTMGFND